MRIHLAQENIDAELELMPTHRPRKRFSLAPTGNKVSYERYLLFDVSARDEVFLEKDNLASELKNFDSEIDIELAGKKVSKTTRIAVDKEFKPVYNYALYDVITLPDGSMKERPHILTIGNVNKPIPVKITDELHDPKELALNYVFRKSYNIVHNNGVTYSFLFNIARSLEKEEKFARVIAFNPETKKPDPLVLTDGGRKFPRSFLEGKTKGTAYCLVLHLSDQELIVPETHDD